MSLDGIDKLITRPKQIWTAIDCLGFLRGFPEEARTRGFPSPSFGEFGYIVAVTKYNRKFPVGPVVNRIGTYTGSGNVCFWPQADILRDELRD